VNKGLPMAVHLAQRGYVERQALANAVKKKTKGSKLLREVLAETNLLTEQDFQSSLVELMEESLYDLLALKEASFNFTEGEAPPRVFDMEQKAAQVALDPSGILMESARRADEWDRIHRVVLSDRDLFVVLEGWEKCGLEEPALDVGAQMDGYTDIEGILANLPYSRFDVLKALSDLVMQGHARPVSVGEIESMADEALAKEDPEEAVALLTHALMTERSNQELRMKLIGLFKQLGRNGEAASELALLGYQQAQLGRVNEALKLYARAAELNPTDLMLHERRVDLLKDEKRYDEFAVATLQFVDLLLTMGLADRTRSSLQKAIKVPALHDNRRLLERLAEVESSLGHEAVAGEIYLGLAKQLPKKDNEGRLIYLKQAFEHRRDDANLGQMVEDLQTGRNTLRRARQRRLLAIVGVMTTLFALGTGGVVELVAAHRVMHALEGNLDSITAGQLSAAMHELEEVRKQFWWTAAGRRAARMTDRLLTKEVARIEGQLARGDHDAVLKHLEWLQGHVSRPDVRQRIDALVQRTKLEQRAHPLCRRANQARPDAAAIKALSELTEPGHLDFILSRLAHDDTRPHVRQALLSALQKIDSPRSFLVVSRLYLGSRDARVDRLARSILERASHHRQQGRESTWSSIYPELEAARATSKGRRAEQVLRWLRGN
ncbi:MAG: DUF4388 domain-containing protein, partial [Planctomycetota bacterium]